MIELKHHIIIHLRYSTSVTTIAVVNKTKYHHNMITGKLIFFLHVFPFFAIVLCPHCQNIYPLSILASPL